MDLPPRLAPLVEQFDWACLRLINRMTGPEVDSGNGTPVPVTQLTSEEYLWEPVQGCWSVRRRADGPGPGATLAGTGEWGRDVSANAAADPYPPPFTTIAWRLSHLSEMLTMRADHTTGTGTLTMDRYPVTGDADTAISAFVGAVGSWRAVLAASDDTALDTVGYSRYPYGSDPRELFIDIIWWVNQEVLHHGAEIALLRDLYRATHG
jgi:hypothetical protein